MRSFSLLILALSFGTLLSAQCNVACSNFTNLAVPDTGLVEVTPEMILEGNYDACPNFDPTVKIQETPNSPVLATSPFVSAAQTGQELLVTITDQFTGNACWGTLKVETFSSLSSGVYDCSGNSISNYTVRLVSTNPNIAVDHSGCTFSGSNLLEYVNCVAADNLNSAGGSFIVKIDKADSYLNGVSTLDQVLIQRHILSIGKFSDQGCEVIAADVSRDNKVSILDLIFIRNVILGISSGFPNAPSWLFFNSETFNNTGTISSDLQFDQSEFPLSHLRVTGIKMGDVNGTAFPGK